MKTREKIKLFINQEREIVLKEVKMPIDKAQYTPTGCDVF
jgi:hypothetical protein